jgi:hypothetical protein
MEDDKLVQRYIALSSPSPTASAPLPDQTALRRILVPSEAVLQRLFDLTAAEARLACSISRGVGRSCGCSWCQGFDGAQPSRQIDDQDGNSQARTAGRSARPGRLSGGLTWTPTHWVSMGPGCGVRSLRGLRTRGRHRAADRLQKLTISPIAAYLASCEPGRDHSSLSGRFVLWGLDRSE